MRSVERYEKERKLCESRAKKLGPELLNAVKSLLVGLTSKEEQFPGHNQAYLTMVAIPRAQNVVAKIESRKP